MSRKSRRKMRAPVDPLGSRGAPKTEELKGASVGPVASAACCSLDEQGIILEVNAATAAMLERAPDTIVGQPIGPLLHPDDAPEFARYRERLFATGEPHAGELRLAISGERVLWIHCAAVLAMVNGDRRVARVVMSESTGRQRADELLRAAKVQLEAEILRRQRTDEDLRVGLEQAERSRLAMLSVMEDQKRAETALAQSHSLLGAALESTADGILVIDLHGRVVRFNRKFLEIWRVPPTYLEERDDQTLMAAVVDQVIDVPAFVSKVAELYQNPEADSWDEIHFRDGRVIERYSQPQRLDDRIVGRVWSFRDITERKRADEVTTFLATAAGNPDESFFKSLARYLSGSLDMEFVCIDRLDPDGLTAHTLAIWCDGKFEDNLTYTLQDTPCGQLVGQAVCCFPENVCRLFPRDPMLQDLRAESYVGATLWSGSGQPIGLIALIGRMPLINRNLSESILKLVAVRAAAELERQQIEDNLRTSEQKFFKTFHSSPVAMSVTTVAEGRYVDANEEFLNMVGRPREELIGRTSVELNIWISPEQRRTVVSELNERGSLHNIELEFVTKAGRIRQVLWSGEKVDIGGEACLLGSALDITERKRTELEIRQSLEEKTALLKEVHHRVKNNLQIVASLLSLQAGRVQHREAMDVLHDTRNRVHSMALLHEVLYSSNNLAQVNFAAYVNELCTRLFRSFGPDVSRVNLEKHVDHTSLPLEQSVPCGLIINELISNALKHAFPDKRHGQITIDVRRTAMQEIVLRVSDDGVGLPPGLDLTATTTLGLRLLTNLVSQLSGRWEIEPGNGTGTTFRVTFPAPREKATEV